MIHVITGPPCAGKSTYIREHAEKGDVIIDFDILASAMGADDHAAEGNIFDVAIEARKAAIKAVISKNCEAWIVDTNHNEKFKEDEDLVELDPGYDVCMERAEADGRPQRTVDAIRQWYSGKKGRTKMKFKEFRVKYSDEGNGSIEGYASTWIRTPDSYGDVVKAGAFARTLKERWNGGKGIPLLWAHQMSNLDAYIGTADAEEDEKGLHFLAKFDGTDEAQRVRELYRDGRLKKFSFAYDIMENGLVTLDDGTKANELRELDLFEISCVCVPANDDAGVIDIKVGRRNSQKDADAIREAITLLQGVLGELEEEADPEDGEDEAKANTAVEELEQSNLTKKEELLKIIAKLENTEV